MKMQIKMNTLVFLGLFFAFFYAFAVGKGIVWADSGADQCVPREAAHVGGRIVRASLADATTLLPPLATDEASFDIMNQVYVALVRYDKDLNLVDWAARSHEVIENGTAIQFTLRDDIRWTDGTPLTVADVQFTYKCMIDPKTPTAYAEDFLNVASLEQTGPWSFVVRYKEVRADSLATWAFPILPAHLLEGTNITKSTLGRKPIGAGPFVLSSWKTGRHIVLRANPDYFLGRPYIDEAVIRVIPDDATMFLELSAGNIDVMTLSPLQYMRQTSGPAWDRKFVKMRYLDASYIYLAYNQKHPFFKDVRVRRAIAHAVDKREIIKGVLLGQGVPARGPYMPGTWMYNTRIQDYDYNPEKARALLAEAGFVDTDGDGIVEQDGRPFVFTILVNQGNMRRAKIAAIIQYRLAFVGIRVTVRTVEWAAFIKNFVNTGRFDAVVLGWNILPDPDIFDVWHSSKIDGGLNFIAFNDPELDQLLETGRTTLDRSERKRMYDRVQVILHEKQPYLFLYVPYALPIVSSRIKNVCPAPAGIDYNFDRWWVSAPDNTQALQK